ncbi:MAG: GNAT family N-acetyltransferase [Candidatus Hermodarchaeota archaeon]
MKIKQINPNDSELIISLASIKDAGGIHRVLMKNLVEIENFDDLSEEERVRLEKKGFLRKKVDVEYYENLIEDPTVDVYIAKYKYKNVIGFATLYKDETDVKFVRDTSINLHIEDALAKNLLTSKNKKFAYLDQISIIPKFQRKKIGTAILNKALEELADPIVSFIVKVPIANKASVYWHEQNGFKLTGTCDGAYKGKTFEWSIYIHWNKKN